MISVRRTEVVEKRPIDKLTIKGFKSLQDVELELGKLNVLIGPNGAGKSNLVSFFEMLRRLVERRLQIWVGKRGGADRILTFGASRTPKLESNLSFGDTTYSFALEHTDDDRFLFTEERLYQLLKDSREEWMLGGEGGHSESNFQPELPSSGPHTTAKVFRDSVTNCKTYHFHDTGETAPVKLTASLHDHQYLRHDASNLAAYLYFLEQGHKGVYEQIIQTVRLAIPFFDDFFLLSEPLNPDSIMLKWRQRESDYPFLASQLSDGSLRFICLVTALMQPDPPSTIIIDEPELGLHPYAISLLGSLLDSASERMQVIVATQSPQLLDEFSVDNLITVELQEGVSVFKRLKEDDFSYWLEDYSVGELWDKNVLGGGLP